MKAFETSAFGSNIAALLRDPRLPELGSGSPNRSLHSALAALTPENAFATLSDRSMALGCISGLWLLHDFLDESHAISQEISTTTGSYWHGIMHRREPDPANAKYWFRHVGHHPVFDLLSNESDKRWDSFAFIDRCEACRGSGDEEELACRQIQLREWHILFAWCHDRATTSA